MDKSFTKLVIDEILSLREAMKAMNETAKKILFVTDQKGAYIGSLSGGDIRRWILAGGSLKSRVSEIVRRDSLVDDGSSDFEEILDKARAQKIKYIPILDSNKNIIDIFDGNVSSGAGHIKDVHDHLQNPVVIMAGGKGTRLAPLTKIIPKALIPIGGKTILEIIIEKFLPYHVKEFYLSVNHKSSMIESYFDDLKPDYSIKYIDEVKPLGTAGALYKLKNQMNKSIIITNCDIIIDADYANILKHHQAHSNEITIITSLKHFNVPYGVCELKNGGELKEIIEKPEYNLLVNTGMYIIEPSVLKYIPKEELFHFTDLIDVVISMGGRIGIYPIGEGAWVDTGEWDEYRSAIKMFGL
jgi:dTDP-glucose pyrophosphorylase